MLVRSTRRRSAGVRFAARRASGSSLRSGLARAGLAARGVMYILIGIIAVKIATGSSSQQADRAGAVRLVASTSFGSVILWLLVIGFAGMTLWRLSEACWGTASSDGRKTSKRLASLGRTVFYAGLTYSLLKFALGVGAPTSTDTQSQDLTAKALHYPGGQLAVVLVGIAFACGGAYLAYNAATGKFLKLLRMVRATRATRTVVERLGQIGGVARGVVFATMGVFLVVAGAENQPDQAKGVDSALRAFARTSAGPWLLIIIAAGLVVFGVYSFCEARWRQV
jgi:Domain of Unknown Function (DUF1206)